MSNPSVSSEERSSLWTKIRSKEIALQRYLRTNIVALEWFSVSVHYIFREVGMIFAICVALYSGLWSWAIKTLAALSFGEVINGIIKFSVREPRPAWCEDIAMSPFPNAKKTWEDDYSFPSSHSQITLCIAISVHYLIPDNHTLVVISYILAIAASLSRAFLGHHYFHDVMASWIIEVVLMIPYWHFIDDIINAPIPVVITVAVFNASLPLAQYLVLKLKSEEQPEQLRKWEEHAQRKTGCKNKKLHTNNVLKYLKQGMCVSASYLGLVIASHYEQLNRLDCLCPNLSVVQRVILFVARFAIGFPLMILSFVLKVFTGWQSPLNILYYIISGASLFLANYLVDYIFDSVAGIKCRC